MTLSERLARLDRVQQSLVFKIAASVLVIALAAAALVTYSVRSATLEREAREQGTSLVSPPPGGEAPAPAGSGAPRDVEQDRTKAPTAQDQANEEIRRSAEATARVLRSLEEARYSVGSIAIGLGLGVLVCLAIIWIGAGLTYLAVAAVGCITALPLIIGASGSARDFGVYLAFALTLASVFTALMQALRVGLSYAHPVFAIARNVVAEAVRLRVTVVFIVVLILGLAALPYALDEQTPLRYRVQSFLQYGAGGSFWLVSFLTVFLAVGSVAFEQRDKIIWQTMTKPVKAWHYVLGKWLGAVGVAGVLLTASSAGVFLFTEHLRNTAAPDERAPFVPADPTRTVTEDRLVLESQVLVARATVRPMIPVPDQAAIEAEVNRRMAQAQAEFDADITQLTPRPDREKILLEVAREQLQSFLSIPPDLDRPHLFEFGGLSAARALGKPLTFRYRFNAGSNLPTDLYRITIYVPGWDPHVIAAPLGQSLSMSLSTAAITTKSETLPDGTKFEDDVLPIVIYNGDVRTGMVNAETITFPPDGLEVSFPVSDWRLNYLRCITVLWLKCCFLAMLGVAAATFLSFPVACLTAFGVLWMAEGATFLTSALDNYATVYGSDREVLWWRYPVIWIAEPISRVFRFYSEITPIDNIVGGRLLSWQALLQTCLIMLAMCGGLFAVGSYIFRRRELATYSGQ